MPIDIPIKALRILSDSHQIPHKDQGASDVKRLHMPLPWQGAPRLARWPLQQARVEHDCNDEEEAEDDDLQD